MGGEEGSGSRPWWKSVWGVIAFVAAFAVVAVGFRVARESGLADRTIASRADVQRKMDRELAEEPTFAALKQHFPEEYVAFRDQLTDQFRAGMSEDEARVLGFKRMRDFSNRIAPSAALAPASDIGEMIDTETAVIRRLQGESAEQCAAFAMGTQRADWEPSDDATRLIGLAAAAKLKAAAAGRRSPVKHAPLTEADVDLLASGMNRAGADDDLVQALLSDQLQTRSVEDQCTAGVAMYAAISSMADKDAARWAAVILPEAAKVMAEQDRAAQ